VLDALLAPWPWWVAGPLIGLFVPALLLVGNKMFGVSANLRTICAITAPGRVPFFRFDWRRTASWNLAFALGIVAGGFLAVTLLGGGGDVAISAATRADLARLGIADFGGLLPDDLFSLAALGSPAGIVVVLLGGFLIGFGASYAGGCTSGHAIMGLADRQLPSLIAVVGFFAGGVAATFWLLPLVLGGGP
jgi:uncharacterized membrane protein YedE/YeeE